MSAGNAAASRSVQLQARQPGGDAFGAIENLRDTADARFEVIGSPYSLLSVSLSASQRLYTRRGTLVAVAGNPDNAQSTLSLLNPLSRAPFGVPFIYQRISATSPITALISTKSPHDDVYHPTPGRNDRLDGDSAQCPTSLDWPHSVPIIADPETTLDGALGQHICDWSWIGGSGEEFVAHPGSVVAYSVTKHQPLPFRFKSASLRFQIPSLTSWIPETEFMKKARDSQVYKFLARVFYSLRTMTRRTIWGDRLFLHFKGPSTILMSSRGVRVVDSLTNEQVNEIADAQAGTLASALELSSKPQGSEPAKWVEEDVSGIRVEPTNKDGKVTFEDKKDLKEFVR
ncbi:hypothetical protein TrVGV298_003866 [Trichoderma virens]|nr:hypothetical protein TrVGV298_003866 [Trichoderma virens]